MSIALLLRTTNVNRLAVVITICLLQAPSPVSIVTPLVISRQPLDVTDEVGLSAYDELREDCHSFVLVGIGGGRVCVQGGPRRRYLRTLNLKPHELTVDERPIAGLGRRLQHSRDTSGGWARLC